MGEIKLEKRVKYAGDVHKVLLEAGFTPKGAAELLNHVPDADVDIVKHARWGEYESFPLAPSMNGYPCSNCGMHFSASSVPILKYCPNCGAKMDLSDD